MNNRRITAALLATTAAALVGVAGTLSNLAWAGPLTPSAGPVTGTYKTLAEVEPRIAINATNTPGDADSLFKITAAGSYYLTGNVTGLANKIGIEIAASGVTIDLNGFNLHGTQTGSAAGIAVSAAGQSDITVINGDVDSWGGAGVDLVANSPIRSSVRNLKCSNNLGSGIRINNFSSATACVAEYNSGYGFDVFSSCSITDCRANNNGVNGIDTSNGCIISGCIVESNDSSGIRVMGRCTVSNCNSSNNNTSGIEVATRCRVVGNLCTENGLTISGEGIKVIGSSNHIADNNCIGNWFGFVVSGTRNMIVRNTCSGNDINWSIVANNIYGPIVDRSVAATAAVSGNTAADTTGNTNPSANFTH